VDDRLTRRALVAVVLSGLLAAGLSLAVTAIVVGGSMQKYRATAQLALVPGPQVPAEEVPSYWEALNGGQAARVAAAVFAQPQWLAPAGAAAGVPASGITTTAGVVESTSLLSVTAETTSERAAEVALDALIASATPTAEEVSGPFAIIVVQSAGGTAELAGIEATQLLTVVFIGGLLLGSGIALVVARARGHRRNDDEPRLEDPLELGHSVPRTPLPPNGIRPALPPRPANGHADTDEKPRALHAAQAERLPGRRLDGPTPPTDPVTAATPRTAGLLPRPRSKDDEPRPDNPFELGHSVPRTPLSPNGVRPAASPRLANGSTAPRHPQTP
jgi:hypothetical protein